MPKLVTVPQKAQKTLLIKNPQKHHPYFDSVHVWFDGKVQQNFGDTMILCSSKVWLLQSYGGSQNWQPHR